MENVNTTLSPLSGRRVNPFERRAQLFFALNSFGDSLRQSKERASESKGLIGLD
jgi:hypothetical protein